MKIANSKMQRPQRWDQPFDPDVSEQDVTWLLSVPPFRDMDAAAFSNNVPLRGVLANDCRILDLKSGDIIVREGDYGSSAFLILKGTALVSLKSLPANVLGRQTTQKKGWVQAIAQLWNNSKFPESRDYRKQGSGSKVDSEGNPTGSRSEGKLKRVFLHDIPRVIGPDESVELNEGEVFGEISALTRSPRSATVVAKTPMRVLEIRWQGFREFLKRHSALREQVDRLYRANSLRVHLREIELLRDLPTIDAIAKVTEFESFGDFQWNREFKSIDRKDVADRILSEPVIANGGEYVDGLILIRSGFARLSRQHGDGHQTVAYLGKGDVFGLRELVHNWQSGDQAPWLLSLRAVGYVDILRIPTIAVEQLILPHLPNEKLPPALPIPMAKGKSRRQEKREETLDVGLMEFLVEQRFINGKQAMMIDLDRCTRCDDCVRACATAHDNNPRFVRQGPKYDHWMITNACMHCVDPVCMIGCPTGAIGRDQESGNVSINDQTCIGCGTCANSCPYENIRMVEIHNTRGLPIVDAKTNKPITKATKCDFCEDQLGGPACQRACPHDALVRIDLTRAEPLTEWSKR